MGYIEKVRYQMMRATDESVDPRVVVASLEQEVDIVVQISVDEKVDP